jgi:hypothetical protein
MSAPDVVVYTVGVVHCSACAPTDMPVEEVTRVVNEVAGPTGLDHGWEPSDAPTFSGGESNPCPCEKEEGRVHRLYVC